MTNQITMTDADRAQGLAVQVSNLTQQLTAVLAENATLKRVIVEREAAAAAADKEKKPAEKK